MSSRRTRTSLYSQADRDRLADAVKEARDIAGFPKTTGLIRATGKSGRSIYALENGEPTVGEEVLRAVGRTLGERLEGWDADTPRRILEDRLPPATPTLKRKPEPEPEGWTDADDSLMMTIRDMLKTRGLRPTAKNIEAMRSEWEREQGRGGPVASSDV